ncbi:Csu type fimbrial protein [Anaeromyxobacter paludicola]|uniref:Spore coat protein U/FanG domain-containing protein n=1 Tax=Anaeromyxobacter paludicola TaxID=2918171 RepID=A0ABN6N3L0_9BACT|nr:spore coat U domain-containing protein [Anaeromyxobacter paludicola]BDG07546.1 hypothetical protein AMPC_06590 [Anaeromyxobacter paludicola]
MKIPSKLALAALAALVSAGNARAAGTATANVAVNATVITSCSITGGSVAFGNYDPLAAGNVDKQGTISVNCNKGTAFSVTLDQGANGSGAVRNMKGATTGNTDLLPYELYTDNARGTVWNATNKMTGTAANKNTAVPFTVYGRIAAGQDVQADTYGDTVVATVTF